MQQYIPDERLRPYVRSMAVAESHTEATYKVLPTTGLVMGFQYSGRLATIQGGTAQPMATAGITGISNTYQMFRNSAATGSVLVYFTETGFSHFCRQPVHELFGKSVSLDNLFARQTIDDTEEQLSAATTNRQRVRIVERLLLAELKNIAADQLVVAAVQLINQSRGSIRIGELAAQLHTSQSPLEKRFRKVVGATPKKFASVVRLHAVLNSITDTRSLIEICYEHNFFDQSHFIKDFQQFTGDSPETYRNKL